MSSQIRRIAVCTGGGDAPGLNAVIRAVVIAAANRGWECYGIREGFNGIMFPERYPEGGVFRLTREKVRGIGHLGGTILGTTNKGNPMHFPMKMPDGTTKDLDRTDEILEFFAKKELDALVSIGGDGSLTIANALHQKGLRVVGVPKTIDNDLDKTFTTFGFDTAVAFATECLDRLHSTAESHQRVMVVEVMGRYAGWIALHAGISGSAHAILIPEIPFDVDKVAAKIRARDNEGRMYTLVLVAEGAEPIHGHREVLAPAEIGHAERLGGVGERIAKVLGERTGKDVRVVVLGHLLRGGSPTSFDRLAAMRFGTAAVRALEEGQSGVMVALAFPNVNYVALEEVAGRMKGVPLDCDTLQTGRDLGISFGD
ncbi:6-phosphofructokinase [Sulfuritalea hydrogenivorans]|jgi:6-phosphofructokinase 1|uniref:ATP-dependent 6-phosphofructokinase n=1 Tax=Sulfuritalea hydrogenivorans sk43H TaxID=1223802 RepID=W0SCZ1_9PROT|nr:ATP-dependent 6-phosphofructokinase [Sulfuritalea hydrogenivorans]MDK9714561.1 ATP-dependent 6-phosphofructokinase [Sulfuritalea sp.]BAO28906.1 6-phosphofructokinase [Sulfuritalea hydrogenivorans sk43H]